MPQMLMTIAQARSLAEKLWRDYSPAGNLVVRKCSSCIGVWQAAGRNEEERPPNFPPDFDGSCPCCGGELHNAPVIG